MAQILAIDQGTSSTKALIFDQNGQIMARGVAPLETLFLNDGWVEQAPLGIYENVLQAVQLCLADFVAKGGDVSQIQTSGISNQRETFVLWDIHGQPFYNAVVWQCKRSAQICERLIAEGVQDQVNSSTGLLLDPYFSGTKLIWLYENDSKIKAAIDRGEAYFGTVDTWLLYQLSGGKTYATDYTNASRTLFFNLNTLEWDKALLERFKLSKLNLPEVKASSAYFGATDFAGHLPKPISIQAMIGDSHAAAFGEACFKPGEAKATLGTGCSILMNTGRLPTQAASGMVRTICWSTNERIDYALEGAIVSCGATVEWLKNELGLFQDSVETAAMAEAVNDNGGVSIIPAFSGLGAPYWQMHRKASIQGLTFGSNKNHIVRAALESIVFQINAVICAMEADSQLKVEALMINGGISKNSFVVQALADFLGIPVVHKGMADVSAFGAALLAGLGGEIFPSLEALTQSIPHANTVIPNPGRFQAIKAEYDKWNRLVMEGLV